eukprot:maker-scaffold147_size311475-snap-gene-1.9 protein:Tk08608 transcript:maker-scaffold147_size311475-snap-gene-1.9-mRNA-1 annotation:"hypothetical protein V466_20010"
MRMLLALFIQPILANNWPTIFEHQLDWASSKLDQNCESVEVTIEYFCTEDPEWPFASRAEFDRLCLDLIPEAFEEYYSGPIKLNNYTYPVRIKTEMNPDGGQHIVLADPKLEECKGLSVNNVIVPAHVYYCNDIQFKYTVSHELGHTILIAAEGILHSATHKGTSTLDQEPRPDGETAACDGTVTFDLMHYFPQYDPNCYDEGIRGPAFYQNAKASENDIQTLMFAAQNIDKHCGVYLGGECEAASDCLQGLTCDTNRCQECVNDLYCGSSQFCYGPNSLELSVKHCRDKKPTGSTCQRNEECTKSCDQLHNLCL